MKENEIKRLIEGIKSNKDEAFEWIFREYAQYCIDNLQKKTGCSKHDAEDILMDSIIAFQQRILTGKVVEIMNIRNYLYTSCINLWRSRRKKPNYYESRFEDLGELPLAENSNEEEYVLQERLSTVAEKAIANLSEKCKKIIDLFYFENKNMREIAELMDFSDFNVAKTTKSRCFKKLVTEAESLLNSYKVEK